jgi:adenylate cyclase class 2
VKTEFEVKILGINVAEIEGKLAGIGAVKIANRSMKRFVYDLEKTETSCKSWIRLRHDGEKAIITFKHVESAEIDGTKEIEFEVADFDSASHFLQAVGFKPTAYQENKRVSYKLGSACFEIDSWPKIPPYLEVEAESKKGVEDAVCLLGFSMQDCTSLGVMEVFSKYGLDIHKFKELKF